jgi:FMN phosphatase YigB (HAD superfamily)
MHYRSTYYFFDIDGTLTRYKPGAMDPEKLLHNNFLFPILRDMMMERGMEKQEAEDRILRLMTDVPFWDYTDFISAFQLPAKEAYERLWAWHCENLEPYADAVEMVKELFKLGKPLFIISNNPYSGCCLKLRACGLADEFGSPYFRRIFSTDKLRGCKNEPGVWQRAVDQIPDDPALIGVVGDNPLEDGENARACGVGETIILPRGRILRGIDVCQETL